MSRHAGNVILKCKTGFRIPLSPAATMLLGEKFRSPGDITDLLVEVPLDVRVLCEVSVYLEHAVSVGVRRNLPACPRADARAVLNAARYLQIPGLIADMEAFCGNLSPR